MAGNSDAESGQAGAEGLRFTHFYNTSRCCPSRAALLSGLYSHQAGMGHMTDSNYSGDGYVGNLNNRCVTIAEALKSGGYARYMCGKWHVTKAEKLDSPRIIGRCSAGLSAIMERSSVAELFDPGMLCKDNTPISAFNDPDYKPQTYYYTDAVSDHACRFIADHCKAHGISRFFCMSRTRRPTGRCRHWRRTSPSIMGSMTAARTDPQSAFERLKQMGLIDPKWDLSPQWGDWEKVENKAWEARCMEVYAAMVDNMDQGVGRIVQTLKTKGSSITLWCCSCKTTAAIMKALGGKEQSPGKIIRCFRRARMTILKPAIGRSRRAMDIRC